MMIFKRMNLQTTKMTQKLKSDLGTTEIVSVFKILWEKEKTLITNISSFSYNVFKQQLTHGSLTLYDTITNFNVLDKEVFWKPCRKRRKFSPFPTKLSTFHKF